MNMHSPESHEVNPFDGMTCGKITYCDKRDKEGVVYELCPHEILKETSYGRASCKAAPVLTKT